VLQIEICFQEAPTTLSFFVPNTKQSTDVFITTGPAVVYSCTHSSLAWHQIMPTHRLDYQLACQRCRPITLTSASESAQYGIEYFPFSSTTGLSLIK